MIQRYVARDVLHNKSLDEIAAGTVEPVEQMRSITSADAETPTICSVGDSATSRTPIVHVLIALFVFCAAVIWLVSLYGVHHGW